MNKVIVAGGGAGGMAAAYAAASGGCDVTLLERNEKLGKKIYITGKGRCNFTNAAEAQDFLDGVFRGRSFAYSSIYSFDPFMLIDLIESTGIQTVTERGRRAFPLSGKASDITKAFTKLLDQNQVKVSLNTYVRDIITSNGRVTGVKTDNGIIEADYAVLSCGGMSYPSTGSDGNGYRLAEKLGHSIDRTSPALVSLQCREAWAGELSGLGLKNVRVSLYEDEREIISQQGEVLFTHKGVSGPCILTMSCFADDFEKHKYSIEIDLKPALSEAELEARLLRDFEEQKNRMFRSSLDRLMPKSLAAAVVKISGIYPDKKVNQVTAAERKQTVKLMKALRLSVSGKGGYDEAVITDGGVNLSQINPSDMQSRIVKNLYFSGEMINLHGFTGGYNLQLAFSAGMLAGRSIAERTDFAE